LDKYGTLLPSYAECNNNKISPIGKMCLKVFSIFNIIHIEEKPDEIIKCNNLTLINLCLLKMGPTNEKTLTITLLIVQVSFDHENTISTYTFIFITFFFQLVCSLFAFIIRYPLASLFYDV